MQEGQGWTVHINVLVKAEGVRKHLEAQAKVSLNLPRGADSTVKDLINAMKSCDNHNVNTANARDLKPFDESKLGYDTKAYGRGWSALEQLNWVSTVSNPRPVNCSWDPVWKILTNCSRKQD